MVMGRADIFLLIRDQKEIALRVMTVWVIYLSWRFSSGNYHVGTNLSSVLAILTIPKRLPTNHA